MESLAQGLGWQLSLDSERSMGMEGTKDPFECNFSDGSDIGISESGLWQRWHGDGDLSAREALVSLFTPYARMVAAVAYKGRFHDEVEFADYHQLACVGLLEAIARFNPDAGVHFKAYATHRIRGAILSGLERQTEKNQQIAAQQRLRKERLDSLKDAPQSSLGETAGSLSGDLPNPLLSYMAEVGIGLALGVMLEGTRMFASPEDASVVASPEVDYFKKSEALQLEETLHTAIGNLAQPERRVIRYHYHQGLAFEEISQLLGISRSRVSQIHRKALAHLRHLLSQRPGGDVFL
ncbi:MULTISPECIES: sigma-70 family RNA polymerase sigma factor [unclassified Acidovorax]|uniref:sigma-70 family RNA polymerase sigma factor n=1 Tax=unclassified Acidovorax TaxID=2684926 RepID=UPI0009EB4A6A|nr:MULTISPECIES: sigma-70 family RNA polymerase sigma factor [unclassified Acidovorax]